MPVGSVAWALRWASEWQVRVFPIQPGSKKPRDKKFHDSATSDPDEIIKLFEGDTHYNIGIACDDLVVVDCDVKRGIDGIAAFYDLDLPLSCYETLAIRTPTGGMHFYYRNPGEPRSNSQDKLAPAIDTRGHHGYVLAPGSNIPKGGYTALNHKAPILLCPDAILERLDAPTTREPINRDAHLPLDQETARIVARQYLADRPGAVLGEGGDKHTYTTAAQLCNFGLEEVAAYDLMSEFWNDKCDPPWTEAELRMKVANGYAYAMKGFGSAHPAKDFGTVKLLPPPHSVTAPWTWHGEPWSSDAQWLFYHMLPATGVAILTGPPGSGKSFMSTYIAEKLATGDHWFGTKPDDVGGSIILAAEAYGSLGPRLSVLGEEGEYLAIAGTPVSVLSEHGSWERMRSEIRGARDRVEGDWQVPVRMIILDTLSASGLIIDENDNGQCAKAMKKLADLAAEFKVLLLVLHHPPKTGSGIRGGSALLGSADYALEIVPIEGKKAKQLVLVKARDAEAPRGLGAFVLKAKVTGMDSRERPITTAYVEATDAPVFKDISPTHYDKFKQAIEWARAETVGCEVGDPVPLEEVRKQFINRMPPSSQLVKQFYKCEQYAIEKGEIEVVGKLGEDQMLLELTGNEL